MARRLTAFVSLFADIIDAKSPFTYQHSKGVAAAAIEIAGYFGMSDEDKRQLRRAAPMHDIGKLSTTLQDPRWKSRKLPLGRLTAWLDRPH